ncbi:MAG: hypothetical protein V4760_03815, partial [Bdellovibrionota bacterium]
MAVLDTRMPEVPIADGVQVHRIKTGFHGYFSGDRLLKKLANEYPSLPILCFSNIPPGFKPRNQTSVFVQNRFVIEAGAEVTFPPLVAARLAFERNWFRRNRANAEAFLVQSASMEIQMRALFPELSVCVAPFVELADESTANRTSEVDFVYVASNDPHKNHARLLEAWSILATEGHFPSLSLVFSRDLKGDVPSEVERLNRESKTRVSIWPALPFERRMDVYQRANALIFPSLFES